MYNFVLIDVLAHHRVLAVKNTPENRLSPTAHSWFCCRGKRPAQSAQTSTSASNNRVGPLGFALGMRIGPCAGLLLVGLHVHSKPSQLRHTNSQCTPSFVNVGAPIHAELANLSKPSDASAMSKLEAQVVSAQVSQHGPGTCSAPQKQPVDRAGTSRS